MVIILVKKIAPFLIAIGGAALFDEMKDYYNWNQPAKSEPNPQPLPGPGKKNKLKYHVGFCANGNSCKLIFYIHILKQTTNKLPLVNFKGSFFALLII